MAWLPIDDEEAPLYSVGQVAEMLQVQQAFLRRLDEFHVVRPARSSGGQRRYSRREIAQIQRVIELVNEGFTLAAVKHLFSQERTQQELEDAVGELKERVRELEAERDAALDRLGELRSRLRSGRGEHRTG